ncbi:MAG: hypothetical protein FI707_15925 [SAR202 cluster bacterium]|nr:hypothetical protein [Chloroflexota bacterium]MDP6420439.1 NHL repeat-containing protein [SAR202 cluster bacterium]MQG58391.1 hypothetical protein [SAR202 cluster bacterium]MQG70265.1 hypothetical protein [SAR202 cluster bacterium]HAL48765.1 hypothetical protein [Dehalococcoidia bacterium]
MSRPYALLRSGFPFHMTLGMRRITTNPMDIGFGQDGLIYVLTRGGLGTHVRVINWDDENLGTLGDGRWAWPSSLLVDSDDNLYVSDEAKHNVTVLDKDGEHLTEWGEHGSDPGQLDRPASLAFDGDGNIVVSDTQNHRIQTFTRDGEYISGFGEHGADDGQLNMPWGICIDETGAVYVADWRNDRVQKFTAAGEHLLTFGRSGSGAGEFNHPSAVAVDAHGDVYVSDWGNDRVQLFNSEGRFVEEIIGEANLSKSGLKYIQANPQVLRLRDMTELGRMKRLRAPLSLHVDDEFRLFICDFGSHRIQVYKKEAYELAENQIAPPLRNPIMLTT